MTAVVRIPVLGRGCGIPHGCGGDGCNPPEELTVPAGWLPRGKYFALRTPSASLSAAGIAPGDTVILRRQARARDGRLVLARFGDDFTLKRLRIEGGRRLLVPDDGENRCATVELPRDGGEILGVVAAIFRAMPGR
ncbi:MAG: hypothetical protein FJ104_08800 [Deltaproteobacteria bacterium]|nr:hypothetical protein [Deltaproteobacteria bacterium]